jgi:hypothetical protein
VAVTARPPPEIRAAWAADPRLCADASGHGADVSTTQARRPNRPAETVAGFLAAAGVFVSLVGVAYRPLRLIPFAVLISLIAVGIGGRSERLATYAVAIGALCFALGLAVAVITSHPLW